LGKIVVSYLSFSGNWETETERVLAQPETDKGQEDPIATEERKEEFWLVKWLVTWCVVTPIAGVNKEFKNQNICVIVPSRNFFTVSLLWQGSITEREG
jgi:hypothetical protein